MARQHGQASHHADGSGANQEKLRARRGRGRGGVLQGADFGRWLCHPAAGQELVLRGRRRKDNGQRALPHDYHGAHHGFRPSPREGLKIRIAGCCYFCRFILNITNNARNITCS